MQQMHVRPPSRHPAQSSFWLAIVSALVVGAVLCAPYPLYGLAAQPATVTPAPATATTAITSTGKVTSGATLSITAGQTQAFQAAQLMPFFASPRQDKPVLSRLPGAKQMAISLPRSGRIVQQAGARAPSAARSATLTLINQSQVDICYVYISPADSSEWGDDWLGEDSTILAGDRHQFKLDPGEYDLMARDCEGNALDEQHGVAVSGKTQWIVTGEEAPPPQETDETPASPPAPEGVLDQFLCCGKTVGGTRIWGIGYPGDWQVELVPQDPDNFVGAVFSDPRSTIEVHFLPSGWTPLGTAMDTGDVDQFLDGYAAWRAEQVSNHHEFLREPVDAFPNSRVWSASWGDEGNQMWESFLVMVTPVPYVEGMSRGALMAQGLRASSADWYAAKSIYVQMLNSVQVEVIGKGGYQPPVSPRQPPSQEAQEVAEEGGSATSFWEMVFCPKACDWERIDIANQAAGQVWCCSDGCVGQLSQVECTAEQCNASCAQ